MQGATELTPGTMIGQDFRVVRPLAAGGMGAVYVVEQLSTGAQRALKVMLARFAADPRARERFVLEARASARIASDHVVEVLAAGVDDASGIPWLVMELLDGATLDLVIERRGCLPGDDAHEVFAQLGHALSAAHSVGLVHRDLKPENVVLATPRRAGAPFTVKVLDFGIAKLLEDGAGSNTQAMGSPRWMAPEQMSSGSPIGPPTDVWALGLLAFYALTGRSYWRNAQPDGTNPMALVFEVTAEPIVPASVRAAELGVAGRVPDGFDAWFARCLERPLTLRFQSAGEATAALLPLLHAPKAVPVTSAGSQSSIAFAPTGAQFPAVPIPAARTYKPTQQGQPVGAWPAPTQVHSAPTPWAAQLPASLVATAPLPPRRRRSRAWLWGVIVVLVLAGVGVGVGAYLYDRDDERVVSGAPAEAQPTEVAPPQVVPPVGPAIAQPAMAPLTPPPVAPVPVPAAPVPEATIPFEAGQRWVGGYVCTGNQTHLVIRVVSVSGDHVEALFDFHNPNDGATGTMEMRGDYRESERRLPLHPGAWIRRPPGYFAAGIDGVVSGDGSTYSGRVDNPMCGGFSVRLGE